MRSLGNIFVLVTNDVITDKFRIDLGKKKHVTVDEFKGGLFSVAPLSADLVINCTQDNR